MSELPDPVQTLFTALLAVAVVVAAAPHLFMDWLRRMAEQHQAAALRQMAIQENLLVRLAMRDAAAPEI